MLNFIKNITLSLGILAIASLPVVVIATSASAAPVNSEFKTEAEAKATAEAAAAAAKTKATNEAEAAAKAANSSQAKTQVCKGSNIASGSSDTTCSKTTGASVNKLIGLIINIFSWVVGVVAVFAIIFGGFSYIISSGDSAKITKARTIILYAIVGLVIVAIAQIIVKFVLGNVTKVV